MAELPVLNIFLGDREIGTLAQLPGDRNLFVFNEGYLEDELRPVLSLSFKDTMGGLLGDPKITQTRLPPFFSNLLPEGRMRAYLAERAGVNPVREFFLLWRLGRDLPGAISALPVTGTSFPTAMLGEEFANKRESTEASILRFSLAGVQIKFSAVAKARGGLTIPAEGVGGSWIVKLPDTKFSGVPENEFVMMELARHCGIDVPKTELVPLKKIGGLPKGIEQAGPLAFAIKRFDRAENGSKIHIEDFAQVFGVYPEAKYAKASYRNIAHVIWAEIGESGIAEFIRRFTFNALIGNGDMHLKNWSLIYPGGRQAALAPAYDFLSTLPYIQDDALALNFVDSKAFDQLNAQQFKRFAGKAGLPEKLVLDTMAATVQLFSEEWRSVAELGIDLNVRKKIAAHLKQLPLWKG